MPSLVSIISFKFLTPNADSILEIIFIFPPFSVINFLTANTSFLLLTKLIATMSNLFFIAHKMSCLSASLRYFMLSLRFGINKLLLLLNTPEFLAVVTMSLSVFSTTLNSSKPSFALITLPIFTLLTILG